MLGASISKNSVLLGIFALITAGVLAGTYLLSRDQIQLAERAAAQRALFEIVPEERHTNDLLSDTLAIPPQAWATLGLRSGGELHIARRDDEVVAVILPAVAPDGYSGEIRMIVGVNRDGSVAGVRVLPGEDCAKTGTVPSIAARPSKLMKVSKPCGVA
jgi:Na+-translocating ferredoxin:NAD+ oxidoreductase subunit G